MSEKEFFKGKTVVITGASSGIGRALAYEFAANGANVVIGARHDTKLAGIAGDLTNRGAAVAWCAADCLLYTSSSPFDMVTAKA